jgi:hypothetical protein
VNRKQILGAELDENVEALFSIIYILHKSTNFIKKAHSSAMNQ